MPLAAGETSGEGLGINVRECPEAAVKDGALPGDQQKFAGAGAAESLGAGHRPGLRR
jgi:hypothetical protein